MNRRFRRDHNAGLAVESTLSRPMRHASDWITPFERRILRLVASGKRRIEIATELNRSPQTISNVLTIAKDKLGARSLAEAAAIVIESEQRRSV